jgi:hypothetical protein
MKTAEPMVQVRKGAKRDAREIRPELACRNRADLKTRVPFPSRGTSAAHAAGDDTV